MPIISGGSGAGSGGMTALFSQTLGADTATIDTNPTSLAGFTVLLGWLYARTDEAVALSTIKMNLNNDATAVYDTQLVEGSSTNVTAAVVQASGSFVLSVVGASAAANYFSVIRFTFPAYATTVGFKVGEATKGALDSTAGTTNHADTYGLAYKSTSAITRIAFTPNTGGAKFKTGTQLIIYGA